MNDQEVTAKIVSLKYKWTPNTDEIEAETDVSKADRRADQISIQYLRIAQKIVDAKHDLAELQRSCDDLHFLFCSAKAKHLELKTAATETTDGGQGPVPSGQSSEPNSRE